MTVAATIAAAGPAAAQDLDRCHWHAEAVRLAQSLKDELNPRAQELRAALYSYGITADSPSPPGCGDKAEDAGSSRNSRNTDSIHEEAPAEEKRTSKEPSDAESEADASRGLRIMPLGSSTTLGKGSDSNGGYRAPLYELLTQAGIRVDFVGSQSDGPDHLPDKDHEGHSGWCVGSPCYDGRMDTGIIDHLDDWLIPTQPDAILLYAGGNDISAGVPGTEVAERTDTLLSQTFELLPDAHVVVGLFYTRKDAKQDEQAKSFNAAMPAIAERHNGADHSVSLLNLRELIREDDFSDQIHLNERGYQKMAEAWMAELTQSVISNSSGVAPSPTLPDEDWQGREEPQG